jgi:hypothetical protein
MCDRIGAALYGLAHRFVSALFGLVPILAIAGVTVHPFYARTLGAASFRAAVCDVATHLFSVHNLFLKSRLAIAAVAHVFIDASSMGAAGVANAVIDRQTLAHDWEDAQSITHT